MEDSKQGLSDCSKPCLVSFKEHSGPPLGYEECLETPYALYKNIYYPFISVK